MCSSQFLGKHVRNVLSYIRRHFLLSFPPRTAAPRWRPRRRKPSAPASPSSTPLGISQLRSGKEMTSLLRCVCVFFSGFFDLFFHPFFSVFGHEVHDQVRLEGLVKNKGLAVFCENTWSTNSIWNISAQLPNYVLPVLPMFSQCQRGPHIRHKWSVEILSLMMTGVLMCLLVAVPLSSDFFLVLWMVPKVRHFTGLWCRKSSLEGNPSRWPGESSNSKSTSSRLCCIVWHLG